METHGGHGEIYRTCYRAVEQGVVFEKKPELLEVLAAQRPTWAVYGADCVSCLQDGVGSHLTVNLLDCDPYGEPFSALSAFFTSERPFPAELWIVVNDGMRQKVQMGGAWSTKWLSPIVQQRGNKLYAVYLDMCRELVEKICASAGYSVSDWHGYYCGHNGDMTHYAARLVKAEEAAPPDGSQAQAQAAHPKR